MSLLLPTTLLQTGWWNDTYRYSKMVSKRSQEVPLNLEWQDFGLSIQGYSGLSIHSKKWHMINMPNTLALMKVPQFLCIIFMVHWLPAIVIKQTGSITFLVELEDKRQVRRHQDHIRYRASTDNTVIVDNQSLDDIDDFLPILPCVNDPVDAQPTVPLHRSHRIRRPPHRFTKRGGL